MEILVTLFILAFVILFYTYIGYGIVLGLLIKIKKTLPKNSYVDDNDLPHVAIVVAAFNEQDIIISKIKNCIAIDYPEDKKHLYVVTDGSDDLTPQIVSLFPKVKLFHQPERMGKLNAVDRVMPNVAQPITIYTDANAMVNVLSIRNMVQHFQDKNVGAVAGEKSVISDGDATSSGEGFYWKYESKLKTWDYKLHSVVGAAGELFAIRTKLYKKPASDTLIEDFIMTMEIAKQGYRVAYEPNAKALEHSSATLNEELKRKVRISAGGLQAVWKLKGILNPFKYGVLAFQYISHRVLRWTLAPLSLLLLFITNLLLTQTNQWFWWVVLIGQLVFYGAGFLGFYFDKWNIKFKMFFIPMYFIFMNLSVYLGLMKLIKGKQSVIWEKAKRK